MEHNHREPEPQIIPISILHVNAFLIQSRSGTILVDAGIPFQEKRIFRALQELGANLTDVQAIILTHGHLDHIGSLAELQRRTGAAVICHESLRSLLESGGYEEAVPRVIGWKLFNPIISRLLQNGISPVQPDRIFEDSLDLGEFGLDGAVLHTPGHSPGSCTVCLPGGICLIGDLLRETSPGSFDTGLFYHDRGQILDSLHKIAARKPKLIYLSHGTTMSGAELTRFLEGNLG